MLLCHPKEIIQLVNQPLFSIVIAIISSSFYVLQIICALIAYSDISAFRTMALSYCSWGLLGFISKLISTGVYWHIFLGSFLTVYSSVALRMLYKRSGKSAQFTSVDRNNLDEEPNSNLIELEFLSSPKMNSSFQGWLKN